MDAYTAVGTTSGIISLVGMIGYGMYKLLVHSHCRSACCGRDVLDVAFNLDEKDGDRTVYLPMPNKPILPRTEPLKRTETYA
jgi:predicted adenine nucleotide alpha hydrolase (AANH) superfamily ATPase